MGDATATHRGQHRQRALPPDEVLSAAELRARRKALGLTQADLADVLGMTATSVARWERSEQRIGNPERVSAALARLERPEPGSRNSISPSGPPGTARRHNLPAQLTTLIGRDDDVADARQLLRGTRLLTITGTGGIGKTRLAVKIAAEVLEDYPDGTWFVDLAPLAEDALVAPAVAAAVGIREVPGVPLISTLGDVLRDRVLLLVLDNCEHLIDACAELVQSLLTRCPSLAILATSREPLRIHGETTWQLPPLGFLAESVVPTTTEVAQTAAGALFVERAKAVLPTFAITSENARPIAELCRRLDGVPLALELAAARVPVLSASQIAERLDDRFALLAYGSRSAPIRQQTLRAAVEWSFDLLSAEERAVFERVSVFAGGWSLEAAEAIVDDPGVVQSSSVLDRLDLLVRKSLVVAEARSGVQRYRQLETLRQFAGQRLRLSDARDAVRERHATYYLRLAERAAPELRGPSASAWLDRLEIEHDNLRATLGWYVHANDAENAQRLCGALLAFWQPRGHLDEAWNSVALVQGLPGAEAPSAARLKVLVGSATIAWSRGEHQVSEDLSEEALQLARALSEDATVAWSLGHLGNLARIRYDYVTARRLFADALAVAREAHAALEEAEALVNLGRLDYLEGALDAARVGFDQALRLYERLGYGQGVVQALRYLGEVAYDHGDYGAARSYVESAVAHGRALEDPWRTAWAAAPLGHVLLAQGDLERASAAWSENLLAWRELGNMNHLAAALEGHGHLAARLGDCMRALRLAGAGARVRRVYCTLMFPEARLWLERWLPAACATLGEPRATSAWVEGETLSVADSIAYALDAHASTPTAGQTYAQDRLTAREREVVDLICQGMTDREIAHELSISEHTAHHHVRNILGKLALRRRAQIAAHLARRQPGTK